MQERPVRIYGGRNPQEHNFTNTRDAANFLSKRLSTVWGVGTLTGKLINVQFTEDLLEPLKLATSDGVISPTPDVGFSTKGNTLIAHVDKYHGNDLIDRGLLWVNTSQSVDPLAKSFMHFDLLDEHGLNEAELEAKIDQIFERGDAFVQGILEGQVDPPFSGEFPSDKAA